MTDPVQQSFDLLCENARETALLHTVESLLGWDERTKLPAKAGAYRAEQMTYLAGMLHRRRVDPRIGEWLDVLADSPLAGDPQSDSGTTIRQLRRQYDRAVKLPQSLVEEIARSVVLGQQIWSAARSENDFQSFRPALEKIVDLKRQEAEAVGYDTCPYDALLDEFEPGERTANLKTVLGAVGDALVPLVEAIVGSSRKPDLSILKRHYPAAAQKRFGVEVAKRIGFSFERGRLDETDHPFCMEIGPDDCRITTRYDEHFLPTALFGILHEAGHGIYEQGLRREQFGLPPGQAVSLGIHESQSRMWENLVGRSRAFWDCFYGDAQAAFPDALSDVPLDDFYFAINNVQPSLIRVEADEVTYNLHILVRFELEQSLINDGLAVADLPDAWNAKYRDYLGIDPPTDADGVMQDIHWSAGLIGYFATYSLGNLYAAQFFDQAAADLGNSVPGRLPAEATSNSEPGRLPAEATSNLDIPFAAGQFDPLRDWLRRNVYERGQCLLAPELIEQVTGRPLSHVPLIRQLTQKYGTLYGV